VEVNPLRQTPKRLWPAQFGFTLRLSDAVYSLRLLYHHRRLFLLLLFFRGFVSLTKDLFSFNRLHFLYAQPSSYRLI